MQKLIKGINDDGTEKHCKECGKMTCYNYEGGLPVGYICDECLSEMVAKCRSRSW